MFVFGEEGITRELGIFIKRNVVGPQSEKGLGAMGYERIIQITQCILHCVSAHSLVISALEKGEKMSQAQERLPAEIIYFFPLAESEGLQEIKWASNIFI